MNERRRESAQECVKTGEWIIVAAGGAKTHVVEEGEEEGGGGGGGGGGCHAGKSWCGGAVLSGGEDTLVAECRIIIAYKTIVHASLTA